MDSIKSNETDRLTNARQECDVLVIGAGPAGATAARAAARHGARVLLVDRRPRIGAPARCAGYVAAPVSYYADVTQSEIQPVTSLVTELPDGSIITKRSPGYVINRELFDQGLADGALAAGAELFLGCRVHPDENGADIVLADGLRKRINARVIIGADGPDSSTGKLIGSVTSTRLLAAQWTMPLAKATLKARIYFHQRIRGGYGWVFPAGKCAHTGIAVEKGSGIRPFEALKLFVEMIAGKGFIKNEPLSVTGGAIPVGEPLICRHGNILLAGDAAGLCHAQTGAGIVTALQSGEMAGTAAARHTGGEEGALRDYSDEIDAVLKPTLKHAASRRQALAPYWEASERDFCRAVRKTWIAFPGYRKKAVKATAYQS